MKERPILFSAPMVRAILAGTKTQTRRVVKLPHNNPLGVWEPFWFGGENCYDLHGQEVPGRWTISHSRTGEIIGCPIAEVGDRLWVREAWQQHTGTFGESLVYAYRATDDHRLGPWRPSIHMPRAASRITLEIAGVRVERLQDISDADAIAEGVSVHPDHHGKPRTSIYSPVQAYRDLWESINGGGSWELNPWVWVVDFKKVEASK